MRTRDGIDIAKELAFSECTEKGRKTVQWPYSWSKKERDEYRRRAKRYVQSVTHKNTCTSCKNVYYHYKSNGSCPVCIVDGIIQRRSATA